MWPLCFFSGKLPRDAADGAETCAEVADSPPPRSLCVDVPHVRQMFKWDCGLACVLMVLRTLGNEQCGDIHDLENLCGTRSIWTVDLAYLLHGFSVNFTFFTVTLGANPHYSGESFYQEQLENDIVRVDGLFRRAVEAGVKIQCRSISGHNIAVILSTGNCIAIALVDKRKLNCSWMSDVQVTECLDDTSEYMGHYVVICGYDADSGEFEIRDPASPRKHEKVSMSMLDNARKSFGTDEDIIMVRSMHSYH